MNFDHFVGRLAERYGISEDAIVTLSQALERGGGRLAQFSHPELGGYGQWMPGMTQIGDMFNRDLCDRVERLCHELSEHRDRRVDPPFSEAPPSQSPTQNQKSVMKPMSPMKPMEPMRPMEPMKPMKMPGRWWPEDLGSNPNSAGGQNETRYAFFADTRRLAVDDGSGNIAVYDTGDHTISGVQQHQSGGGRKVTFTSQHGEVDLAELQRST